MPKNNEPEKSRYKTRRDETPEEQDIRFKKDIAEIEHRKTMIGLRKDVRQLESAEVPEEVPEEVPVDIPVPDDVVDDERWPILDRSEPIIERVKNVIMGTPKKSMTEGSDLPQAEEVTEEESPPEPPAEISEETPEEEISEETPEEEISEETPEEDIPEETPEDIDEEPQNKKK